MSAGARITSLAGKVSWTPRKFVVTSPLAPANLNTLVLIVVVSGSFSMGVRANSFRAPLITAKDAFSRHGAFVVTVGSTAFHVIMRTYAIGAIVAVCRADS